MEPDAGIRKRWPRNENNLNKTSLLHYHRQLPNSKNKLIRQLPVPPSRIIPLLKPKFEIIDQHCSNISQLCDSQCFSRAVCRSIRKWNESEPICYYFAILLILREPSLGPEFVRFGVEVAGVTMYDVRGDAYCGSFSDEPAYTGDT